MNSIIQNNFAGIRNLAQLKRDLCLEGCQINPVVLHIRDNGPAVVDGEYRREHEMLPADASAGIGAWIPALGKVPGTLRSIIDTGLKQYRSSSNMIIAALLLSFSFISVTGYALQQRNQVQQLEAELTLLKSAEQEK